MTTRTIIISALIAFALLVGGMIWLYTTQNKDGGVFTSGTSNPLNFFPFGGNSTQTPSGGTGNQTASTSEDLPSQTATKLHQVTNVPVAGATELIANSVRTIRYLERSTGHIYDTPVETIGQVKRVSNTTVPKVLEAQWGAASTSVILRYLDESGEEIISYSGKLMPSGTESELAGTFLPRNSTSLTISPDGSRVASVVKGSNGASVIVSNIDGSKKTEVFESPLAEWIISWPSTTTIALTTKASETTAGYLYLLNTGTLKLSRMLGDVLGLTATVNSTATKIVYSQSGKSGVGLRAFDIKTGVSNDLPLTTLPFDKCVWSVLHPLMLYCGAPIEISSNLPDAWYQGVVSFDDNLWILDLTSGNATLVDLLEIENGLDVIHPFLSKDERYLYFTNKKDGTLWSLSL